MFDKAMKYCIFTLILMTVLITIACTPSIAVSAPATALENHYGGAADQVAHQVWQTSDKGFIIVGTGPDTSGTGKNMILVKTDPFSNVVWSKNIGGTYGYSVRQTGDGGFIATGAHGDNLYLVKTDASGNKLWEKDFVNSTGQSEGFSIQQTGDGGYIIVGDVTASTGKWEMYLLKTDAGGNEQWDAYYGSADVDVRTYSVWITSDGGYVVGGYIKGGNNEKPFILKADANGNITWARSYEGPGTRDTFLSDWFGIQQTRDGGYIYAGARSGYMYLLKTDASGNRQWDRNYGINGANAVQQTWDDGYILAGSHRDTGGVISAYVVRTDAGGNKLWDNMYKGIGYAEANSVIQIGTGAYVFAGSTKADQNSNNNIYFLEIGKDMTPVPNAKLVSDTIPAQMEAGHTYNVQVTFENTGTMPWTYQDNTAFGYSGDAAKFGLTGANQTIRIGRVIRPGQSETFNFTMTAPGENGTYNPMFQMMWEGHNVFGALDNKTVVVVNNTGPSVTTPTSAKTSDGSLPCLPALALPLLVVSIVTVSWIIRKKKGEQ